jgi:uncharacterized protein YehS (DUF1456 family)
MALGGCELSDEQVRALLQREGEETFVAASVEELSAFLDGLIVHRRGKREQKPGQGPLAPIPAGTNNIVLRKLRIAFDLKEQGMLELLDKGGFPLSKPELSALFRKQGHKHYRECGDQVLRYFLDGLTRMLRPQEPEDSAEREDRDTGLKES